MINDLNARILQFATSRNPCLIVTSTHAASSSLIDLDRGVELVDWSQELNGALMQIQDKRERFGNMSLHLICGYSFAGQYGPALVPYPSLISLLPSSRLCSFPGFVQHMQYLGLITSRQNELRCCALSVRQVSL